MSLRYTDLGPLLDTRRPSLATACLFLASLSLSACALLFFVRYPEFVWDGLVLAGAGVVTFAMTIRTLLAPTEAQVSDPSLFHVVWRTVTQHPWRGISMLAALLSLLYLLRRLPTMPPDATYTTLVWTWIFAFLLYGLAVAPPRPRARQDWSIWWEINRTKVFAIGVVMLVAIALRIWRIGSIPYVLGGDEASQGLEAMRVLRGQIRNPFATGWLSVPTMSFYYNSLTLRFLGQTMTALRLPWAFVGIASVLVSFWVVTRLKGVHLGLTTAALLATYHYHIHFSRLGSNQIADPFFVGLALLLLYRAIDRHSPLDWALLGGTAGLSLYFYVGARFTPLLIAAILIYLLLCDQPRFWHEYRLGILVAIGAFFMVAAPMLQYALRFPDVFNARLNQVGIIQSGWLAREVGIRGESAIAILFDQFRRAALAFNYYPDRTVWYGLKEPLLDPVFGGLFLVGLGYGTVRALFVRPDRRLVPFVFWWWGGMLTGGMLTESPPSSQRLVTLTVPVCFFIALALWRIIRLVDEALDLPLSGNPVKGVSPASPYVLASAAVIVFAGISVGTYFWEYTPKRLYGGMHAELATEAAPLLAELGPSHRIYFVGAPWMYWEFATLPYLVPAAEAEDILEPIEAPPPRDMIPPGRGAVFVFHRERAQELTFVRQAYPSGTAEEIRLSADGELLAILYIVPPD